MEMVVDHERGGERRVWRSHCYEYEEAEQTGTTEPAWGQRLAKGADRGRGL